MEAMLPLTLGANIGTTATALLASMVSDRIDSLQVALARIMANLKAAGYDSVSLSLDEELFPAYVQVASALWSRQSVQHQNRRERAHELPS